MKTYFDGWRACRPRNFDMSKRDYGLYFTSNKPPRQKPRRSIAVYGEHKDKGALNRCSRASRPTGATKSTIQEQGPDFTHLHVQKTFRQHKAPIIPFSHILCSPRGEKDRQKKGIQKILDYRTALCCRDKSPCFPSARHSASTPLNVGGLGGFFLLTKNV